MATNNDDGWTTGEGDWIRTGTTPVAVTDAYERLISDTRDQGAAVTFSGRMRGHDDSEQIFALYLEHYPAMTRLSLEQLIRRVRACWPVGRIVLEHRVGYIQPEETIVFVGVTATHRAAAFDACDSLMDSLKTEAPFWKKAYTANGAHWVASKKSDRQRAARWRR